MIAIKQFIKKCLNLALWLPRYLKFTAQFLRFRQASSERMPVRWRDRFACLLDATANTGFDRHYVFHPAWAMRRILERAPGKHIDISSTLHFCSMLSAVIPVEFYDYRPAELGLSGLSDGRADLLALPFEDATVASLSCMHVIEHIGLGRYGDPMDPDGDLKAIAELKRVLRKDGDLYFVVPIAAQPRIQFNAHRVYSHAQVQELFAEFEIADLALIPDNPADGGLVVNPSDELMARQNYACGCYHLRYK